MVSGILFKKIPFTRSKVVSLSYNRVHNQKTMKTLYNLLLITVAFFATSMASAAHLGAELLVTAKLNGEQEVPSVNTDAEGLASFTISENRDSVNYQIVVNNLSGPITGIHIHEGEVGSNGGVLVNLTPSVDGNLIVGSIASADISNEFIGKLLTGAYYLNVHTSQNASGEIRGQLHVESDKSYYASLDTAQQVHSVNGNATGSAIFDISLDKKTLTYYVVTNNLSGSITGAHFHNGKVGQAGGVEVNLSSGINGTILEGSLDITSNTSLISDIELGSIYVNIHTTQNPNGEIRGQVMETKGLAFDSKLSIDQETHVVLGSTAKGTGHLALNATLDTLKYSFLIDGLSGSITGAHLHEGSVGTSGGVLLNLSSSINGNWIEGMATGSDISSKLVTEMLKGSVYVNVHTSMNPNGETRGQVYRLAREGYTFNLTGANETHTALTNGFGVGITSIDRNQSNAHFMAVVTKLSGEITGAHFHNAVVGNDGPVIFNMTSEFEQVSGNDAAYGFWNSSSSTAFTAATSLLFRTEAVYMNVHTQAYAAGELRGQADRGLAIPEFVEIDNGDEPMDVELSGGILFTSRLSGSQEVPSVNTDATGVAGLVLSADLSTATLNVTFDGLGSAFTGAHIHEGASDENGNAVVDLGSFKTSNQIEAEITSLDLEKLAKGMYYINIHTKDNPGGEIRGQLKLETETSFVASVTGNQEVPSVSTDGTGLAHFYLANNNTELRYMVVFDSLSGEVTGAHLHEASAGSNGNVVVDLTGSVNGNIMTGSVDPSAYLDALLEGNIYLNIHTQANASGEIRGQLNLSNGWVYRSMMNGAQEVPESRTTAKGMALFTVNYSMDTISYISQYANISGAAVGAHLHNGDLGVNGNVQVNLTSGIKAGGLFGVVAGASVSAELIAQMNAGDLYLNIHTLAFPAGEIRGQVNKMSREGYCFNQCGAQEVPSVETTGYGTTIIAYDMDQTFMHMMMVNTNLEEEVTAAHIHNGAPGNNGGVLFGLELEGSNYFAYKDTSSIDTALFRAFQRGNAYVNIHTASNPNGEMRGQVDNDASCPAASANLSANNLQNNYSGAVYPNPATDHLTVDLGMYPSNAQLQIINMMGSTVLTTEVAGSGLIDLSSLPSGVYSLQISGKQLQFSQKLLVQ